MILCTDKDGEVYTEESKLDLWFVSKSLNNLYPYIPVIQDSMIDDNFIKGTLHLFPIIASIHIKI